MGQWDSDYKGGGGGKVSETTNKERGARVFRLQRRVGGIKGLNLQRRGWGQGVSDYREGEWGKGTQTTEWWRDKGAQTRQRRGGG